MYVTPARAGVQCVRGGTSITTFMTPSLALHRTPAYLATMTWRRLVSGVLTLMAVQYAAFGIGPSCAADHHPAGTATADLSTGMTHDGPMAPGSTDPCAPNSPDSNTTHTPLSCLAMAGCAATGIAAGATAELAAPQMAVAPSVPVSAGFRSILTPPETPPPIA